MTLPPPSIVKSENDRRFFARLIEESVAYGLIQRCLIKLRHEKYASQGIPSEIKFRRDPLPQLPSNLPTETPRELIDFAVKFNKSVEKALEEASKLVDRAVRDGKLSESAGEVVKEALEETYQAPALVENVRDYYQNPPSAPPLESMEEIFRSESEALHQKATQKPHQPEQPLQSSTEARVQTPSIENVLEYLLYNRFALAMSKNLRNLKVQSRNDDYEDSVRFVEQNSGNINQINRDTLIPSLVELLNQSPSLLVSQSMICKPRTTGKRLFEDEKNQSWMINNPPQITRK